MRAARHEQRHRGTCTREARPRFNKIKARDTVTHFSYFQFVCMKIKENYWYPQTQAYRLSEINYKCLKHIDYLSEINCKCLKHTPVFLW